jgi:predicted metal-dependent peptidase
MNIEARDRISVARMIALKRVPYMGAVLWSLVPFEVPGMGTIGCDAKARLFYDPEVVMNKWDSQTLAGALIHEGMHLLLDHHTRILRVSADSPALGNVAADMTINPEIKLIDSVKTGSDWIFPDKFGLPPNLTMEEYYDLLKKQAQNQSGKGQGGKGKPDPNAGIGSGHCGGCAGEPSEAEGEASKQAESQGIKGQTGADQNAMRRQVAEDIKHAKERGTVPGEWARWADEVLGDSPINWRDELRAVVANTLEYQRGIGDFTYTRRSRRQECVGDDIILPGSRTPVPDATVIIDTSGSMNDVALGTCLREVKTIINSCCKSIRVMAVDAAVHQVQQVFSSKAIKLQGGGGTSMAHGVREAMQLRPKPRAIIVLTDGYTDWPDANDATGCKLIWGIINNEQCTAPVGKTVHIEVDGA